LSRTLDADDADGVPRDAASAIRRGVGHQTPHPGLASQPCQPVGSVGPARLPEMRRYPWFREFGKRMGSKMDSRAPPLYYCYVFGSTRSKALGILWKMQCLKHLDILLSVLWKKYSVFYRRDNSAGAERVSDHRQRKTACLV